jgi:hypothetical protein
MEIMVMAVNKLSVGDVEVFALTETDWSMKSR